MKLLRRVLPIFCLLAGSLAAQDVIGRWTGAADWTDEAGAKHQQKSTIEIRNEDGKLTGNMVNAAGKPGLAFQVQQDGAKFNLYAFLTLDGGEHLRWKVELKGGSLVGTFSAQHDNPKKWMYDRVLPMSFTKAPPAEAK
jgi:hypothetical protein